MGVWDKFKSTVGLAPPEPPPPPPPQSLPTHLLSKAAAAIDEHTPKLTWQQRAIGFSVCLAAGLLMAFMSLTLLWTFQLVSFAILYSFGSVLSLLSTLFLMGFRKQIRNMFQGGRWIATLVYLCSIVVTLIVAFTVGGLPGGILCIILIFVQFLAMVWYCATYIPGGQDLLARCFGIRTSS